MKNICKNCVYLTYKNQELNVGRCGKYAHSVNLDAHQPCFLIELPAKTKRNISNNQLDLFQ